jgi:hypothetical protein
MIVIDETTSSIGVRNRVIRLCITNSKGESKSRHIVDHVTAIMIVNHQGGFGLGEENTK